MLSDRKPGDIVLYDGKICLVLSNDSPIAYGQLFDIQSRKVITAINPNVSLEYLGRLTAENKFDIEVQMWDAPYREPRMV